MARRCFKRSDEAPTRSKYEPPEWDLGHRRRHFQPKVDVLRLREALRTKITNCYRHQYNVMLQVGLEDNVQERNRIESFHEALGPATIQIEEASLRKSMEKVETYEKVATITTEMEESLMACEEALTELDKEILAFDTKIGRYSECQNFLYLAANKQWRKEHDWVNRDPAGRFLTIADAIQNRKVINSRPVGASIEVFFGPDWEPLKHDVAVPFSEPVGYKRNLKELRDLVGPEMTTVHKMRSKICKARFNLERLDRWRNSVSKRHTANRAQVLAANETNQERVEYLRSKSVKLAGEGSVLERQRQTSARLDSVLFTTLKYLTANAENDSLESLSSREKAAGLERIVVQLLFELDGVPFEPQQETESRLRTKRRHTNQQAVQACVTQTRIQEISEGLQKSLKPPFQKPPAVKPLPISRLPPPPTKPAPEPPTLTFEEQVFIEAFTDKDLSEVDLSNPKSIQILRDAQLSCLPFYFDHFLTLQGHVPEKDFVPEIMRQEGPEVDKMEHKDVLPEVHKRLRLWEVQQEVIKRENIKHTKFLYEKN